MTPRDQQLTIDYATCEEIRSYLGTSNWCVARCTARIVERYGEDVVCLTQRRYREMVRAIIAARVVEG